MLDNFVDFSFVLFDFANLRKLVCGCNCSPLGPFVPAPPEVALRMFRDQSGPPSFEGGGRNGRSGSQMSGAGPILMPPNFRQDPRRIRR